MKSEKLKVQKQLLINSLRKCEETLQHKLTYILVHRLNANVQENRVKLQVESLY